MLPWNGGSEATFDVSFACHIDENSCYLICGLCYCHIFAVNFPRMILLRQQTGCMSFHLIFDILTSFP